MKNLKKAIFLILICLFSGIIVFTPMQSVLGDPSSYDYYDTGDEPSEFKLPFIIEYSDLSVTPMSGNTYRFKLNIHSSSFQLQLYLVIKDKMTGEEEEYETHKVLTYGPWYFNYGCYCWTRKQYYEYNYIDVQLDDIDGRYEFYFRKSSWCIQDLWKVYFGELPTSTLLGSSEHHFPMEPQAYLGFSIQSIYDFRQDPTLHFKLDDAKTPYQNIFTTIKIDGILVYARTTELDTDLTVNSNFYMLRGLRSHQIVIEIEVEEGSLSTDYVLKYLKIGRLCFKEYNLSNGLTCGPTQIFGFGPYRFDEEEDNYDIGYIAEGSSLPFTASSGGETNTPSPSFYSSIVAEWARFLSFIDRTPDFCVWIDKIKIQYRIIQPNGTPIIDNRMIESGSLCTSHSSVDLVSPEVKTILDFISMGIDVVALFTEWAPILLPVSWTLKAIGAIEGGDSEGYGYLQDGWYERHWENGDNVGFTPLGELAKQISMRFYWSTNLPQPSETVSVEEVSGPYQVQVSWIVDIDGGNGHLYTWNCIDFMNFIYNPPAFSE